MSETQVESLIAIVSPASKPGYEDKNISSDSEAISNTTTSSAIEIKNNMSDNDEKTNDVEIQEIDLKNTIHFTPDENLKSDTDKPVDDESDSDDDEEKLTISLDFDSETDESCSRARPYIRGQKTPKGAKSNGFQHNNVVEKREKISFSLPTPPDESLETEAFITKSTNVNVTFVEKYEDSIKDFSTLSPSHSPSREGNSGGKSSVLEVPVTPESSTENVFPKDDSFDEKTTKPNNNTALLLSPSFSQNLIAPLINNVSKTPCLSNDLKDNKLIISSVETETLNQCTPTTTSVVITTSNCSNTHSTYTTNSNSRRGSKIPVGIAVAWQRLVTTSCDIKNSTTSITDSCVSSMRKPNKDTKLHYNHNQHSTSHNMEFPPKTTSLVKVPQRPSSASPGSIKALKDLEKTEKGNNNNPTTIGSSYLELKNKSALLENKSLTPDPLRTSSRSSASAVTFVPNRPLPSSSVPPNLGYPSHSYVHPGSLLDYHYGMRSLSPFNNANPHFTPTSWQSFTGVASDLAVPQGFSSPAAYLQQTMHNRQIQLQQQHIHSTSSYGNYISQLSPYLQTTGYETALRTHYEQLVLQSHHQQQHSAELLRQFHHQQLLCSSGGNSGHRYDSRTPPNPPIPTNGSGGGNPRISISILSPTIGGVRTPTPTTPQQQHQQYSNINQNLSNLSPLSPLSSAGINTTANWPAELYHRNSSTALSPKSLTSSSPSPVTVQHLEPFHSHANTTTTTTGGSSAFGIFDRSNNTTFTANSGGKKGVIHNLPLDKSFTLHQERSSRETTENSSLKVNTRHLSVSLDEDVDDNHCTRVIPGNFLKTGKTSSDLSHMTKSNTSFTNKSHGVRLDTIDEKEQTKQSERIKQPSSPLPMSPSSGSCQLYKHDFTRMESLIEKEKADFTPPLLVEETNVKVENADCDLKVCGEKQSVSSVLEADNHVVKVETDLVACNHQQTSVLDLKQGVEQTVKLSFKSESEALNLDSSPLQSFPISPASMKSPVKLQKKTVGHAATTKTKSKKTVVVKVETTNKTKVKKVAQKFRSKQYDDKILNQERRNSKKDKLMFAPCLKDQNEENSKKCKTKSKIKRDYDNNDAADLKEQKPKKKQSKKVKEIEATNIDGLSSCDLLSEKYEDYNGKLVPDSNLPVTNKSTFTVSKSKVSNNIKLNTKTDLQTNRPVKVNSSRKKDSSSTSGDKGNKRKRSKAKEDETPKPKRIKKEKGDKSVVDPPVSAVSKDVNDDVKLINHNNLNSGVGVSVTNANYAVNSSNGPTTVIFTSTPTTNQSIPISLNPTIFSNGESSSKCLIGPVFPLPYHNSPVTLILPRILPQCSSISNSQTSFKLVVSSQEIKIPSFIPNQVGSTLANNIAIQGTTQTLQLHHHHQEQNSFVSNDNIKLQNSVASSSSAVVSSLSSTAAAATESSLLMTPCDNDINKINSTLTFLTNNVANVNRPLEIQPSSNTAYQIRPNDTCNEPNIFLKRDFIQPEDHLNLLASVAQEFGSREDLGKLASASNSSRGSSLMTSPVMSMQSPEANFLTPSSSSSCNTTVSISLPSSPLVKSKSPHDEYEYDEKEPGLHGGSHGSYKHPVWLKIPHIVPQAANKVAEKLKKAQRKQEKAVKKSESDKKTQKSKSTSINSEKLGDDLNNKERVKEHRLKKEKLTLKSRKKANNNSSSQDTGGIDGRTLKIPNISFTTDKAQQRLENHSPKKRSKSKEKYCNGSELASTMFHKHSNVNTKGFKMKMTLPVPKIRIKLADADESSFLRQSNSSFDKNSPINKQCSVLLTTSDVNACSKQTLQRRHSDGDRVKVNKRKHNHNHDEKTVDVVSKKKRNSSISTDLIKKQKTFSVSPKSNEITTEEHVLPASSFSFTSLTPPPTAKSLVEKSMFSSPPPSTAEIEMDNEHSNNSSCNLVQDPTFAASAIRIMQKESLKQEKGNGVINVQDESDLSSIDGTNTKLKSDNKKEKRKLKLQSNRISLMTNTFNQNKNKDYRDNAQDSKSLPKAFVPYTPRRVSSSKSLSPTSPRNKYQIKPCLKPEPIVRPRISSDENSDAEIDLEVASLTNSIPRSGKSLLQQYRDNRRHQSQQDTMASHNAIAPNQSSRSRSNSPIKAPSRRLSSTNNVSLGVIRENMSPTKPQQRKPHFGRRLSLNLETGRTREVNSSDEEELLDIGETYSTAHGQNKSPTHSLGNENKHQHIQPQNQSRSNNKHGSTTITVPRRLPKKRTTRSLTLDRVGTSVSGYSSSIVGGGRATKVSESDKTIDETRIPGKIQLESVTELLDEMRILTEIQGLFYTGKLNALQPPDVYGVTLDNERGNPPHLIFSAEEVLEKCIREKKPSSFEIRVGLRICAFWSAMYTGLYSGKVSKEFNPYFNPEKDLIPISFDDGDNALIKLSEIRLLPSNHPLREYDPNPLITLEKKQRRRRNSSTNTTSGCTGDHEEEDCGESYCVKLKLDEDDTHHSHSFKSLWTWTGVGFKSKSKKNRNKEFFRAIQRKDEVIQLGDSAIFNSHDGNDRPYIGRIEKFWEKKGQKIVTVRWFYHPEEVKSPKRIPHLKYTGALFESPHIDENDVQTIAKKCDVLPFGDFKERIGRTPKLSLKNSTNSSKPKDMYYVAGYYDPYTYNLQFKI